MRLFPLLLAPLALAAHLSHQRLLAVELPAPRSLEETYPSLDSLRLLSLGHRSLVADYYWLRAIAHFGTKELHAAKYPNLVPLVERVVGLDPQFVAAYVFAGTVLTVDERNVGAAQELLRRGMRARPDVWRIPFLLGFNAYYFQQDYATAAWAMAEAARLPGAPEITAGLAARLAAEAGQPEVGLRLLDALIATTADEELLSEYLDRRRHLELEEELAWLNTAARRFAAARGRPPATLGELVGPGLMRELPEADPLGGSYYVDAQGSVQTTSEERRLRLSPEAKGAQP